MGAPLLPRMTCIAWEADKYATFGFDGFDVDGLTRLTDWLFGVFYAGGETYPLDIEQYEVG